MRKGPRQVHPPVRSAVPEGDGCTQAGLGPYGHVLRLPRGALAAPAHDEHRGVTVCGRAAAHLGRKAVQAGRERDGTHLEAAHGGGEDLPSPECAAPVTSGARGCEVRRWSGYQRSTETDRRLNPIYTLIDATSPRFSCTPIRARVLQCLLPMSGRGYFSQIRVTAATDR